MFGVFRVSRLSQPVRKKGPSIMLFMYCSATVASIGLSDPRSRWNWQRVKEAPGPRGAHKKIKNVIINDDTLEQYMTHRTVNPTVAQCSGCQ